MTVVALFGMAFTLNHTAPHQQTAPGVCSQLLWTLPSQNHSPLVSCRRMTVDQLPIPGPLSSRSGERSLDESEASAHQRLPRRGLVLVELSRGCAKNAVRGSICGSRVDPERTALPVVRAQDVV